MSQPAINFGGRSWDKFAADYASNLMNKGLIAPLVHDLLKGVDEFQPFNSALGIVDVGCGPGTAIKEFLEIYGPDIPPSATLTAFDSSEGMIAQVQALQATHAGNEVWDRLETHVWDLQDLGDVAHGTFSHVLGNLVFMILKEPRVGLAEAHRVLRKDGVIGLTSMNSPEWMEVIIAASQMVRPDLVPTQPVQYIPQAWTTTEGILGELEQTGFRDIQAHYQDVWMSLDDPGFMRFFIRSKNPLMAKLLADFSEEDFAQMDTEIDRMVDERCPTAPKKLRGKAVVAMGRK